jgi:hypothetical protein
LSSSDESIAPSTSKQTETVESKSFSKHSIQNKKKINKKRKFFGTKSSFQKKPKRYFIVKSAASDKRHLNVNSDSDQEATSNKIEPNKKTENSRKGVNKKFKVKKNIFK